MLTKGLLRYQIRKGILIPEFISPESTAPYDSAERLLSAMKDAEGISRAELELRWDDLDTALCPQDSGLRKILLDTIEWQDFDEDWAKKRFALIVEAQKLREEALYQKKESFQEIFADMNETTFTELEKRLYQDLPEEQVIAKVPDFFPESLIDRYNCVLAQSILLRCKGLHLTLSDMSHNELRVFFQAMKFHQLVAEFKNGFDTKSEIQLFINGPLSVLDSAQSYGMKLAVFFPHIIACKKWGLSAELDFGTGRKKAILNLSHESGLKSHYKKRTPYIPKEFKDFCIRFNQESVDWQVREGCSFLHIGQQSWCFPDLEFFNESGQKVLMELFHRWHKGTLSGRIRALYKNPIKNLLIGVQKPLIKDPELKKIIENSEWFQERGVVFREFPTVKSVLSVLGQYHAPC